MNLLLSITKGKKSILLVAYCLLISSIAQSQLNLVASYPTNSYETAVFATENYVYIGNVEDLSILDISDIQNPVSVGNVSASGQVNSIYVSGDYAYVGSSSGLSIVDVSDPTNATLAGFYSSVQTYDVFVKGDYVYLADEDGFKIIDASDPTDPQMTGSLSFWPAAESLFVTDSLAYVGVLWDGIKVVDISNPDASVQVGTTPPSSQPYGSWGWATDIHVHDEKVYLTDGHDGLFIFEHNGMDLDSIGSMNFGYAAGLYVDDDYVYLGDSDFQLLEVSDTNSITVVDSHSSNCDQVHVSGKYIFLGDSDGLTILEIADPVSIDDPTNVGFGVFPNPTDGQFTIEMKASKQITIEVYDALGKNVFESKYDNVVEGQKEMITLSGIATGTYYIRLNDGEHIYTEKIVVF